MVAVRKIEQPHTFTKMSMADQAEIGRLVKDTNYATRQIRRAFLEAVKKIEDRIDVRHLTELLRAGRVQVAVDYVNLQLQEAGFRQLANTVSNALLVSGLAAAEALTRGVPTEIEFTFGLTNPKTIEYLRTAEANLIREATRQTQAAVMTVIRDGVTAGRNPLDVARDIKQFIGLTDRQTQAVLNYRRALETRDSAALQRMLRDRRFDPTVRAAIANDTPLKPAQIDKMVERYRQRYLKYRAETIARTEAIRAVNKGNQLLWQQAVDDGKVEVGKIRRKWIYTHDLKTRHAHRTIPGLNPDGVGLNEPFQSALGPIKFPGDPDASAANTINCRCTVVTRFRL
jgi:hypothetical protein